jgi:hypothetical protein
MLGYGLLIRIRDWRKRAIWLFANQKIWGGEEF